MDDVCRHIIRLQEEKYWYRRLKFLKKKTFYLNIIAFIPVIILNILYYQFICQKNKIYKSYSFSDIDIELYKSVKIKTNNIFNRKNENFDVYIIDNKSKKDLIFFHGAHIKRDIHLEICENLSEKTGYNIIVPFYRGYGPSKGNTDELSIMTDLHILKDILKNRKTERCIVAQSLGCAAAIYFSAITNFDGNLVLENPFLSLEHVVKNMKFHRKIFSKLLTEKWNNLERIPNLKCKISFLISKKDKLVPNEHSEELSKHTKNPKFHIFENSNHFNTYKSDEYYDVIEEFINRNK